jgi:hypothetical protein
VKYPSRLPPKASLVLLLTGALLIWPLLWGVPARAGEPLLEDLHYKMAVLIWPDAARVRVTLKSPAPGRLVAEVVGETRGGIKLFTGERRERLQTEMIWRDHRLLPMVYREESWRQGSRRLKEYRFDYPRKRLVMWQGSSGKDLQKKWETALPEPVYDPLSAFYNCRLGVLGPSREGETSTIPGIPYPNPEALEVRLGPETAKGRQAMVSLVNPVFEGSRGAVFAWVDDRRVPRQAWTTVLGVTIKGALLPDSIIMPAELPGIGVSGPVAGQRPPLASPLSGAGSGNPP